MKKLIILFLAVILTVGTSLSAAAADAGTIEIAAAEGEAGGTAEVTIRLNSSQTLGAVGLHLIYDSSVLTLTEILCEEGFSEGSWNGNPATARLIWADTKGMTPSGGKPFMTLVFRIADSAAPGTVIPVTAEYDPNGDICDLDRQPLQMTVSDGSVTVTAKAAEPEETTTAVPEETTTAEPEETTTAAPEETTTAAPEETTTAVPEETTTAAPKETTTAAPEETTTAAPEETATAAPEETATAAPAETTTAAGKTTAAAPAETTAASQETAEAAPAEDDPPRTGDAARMGFYAALGILSACAMTVLLRKKEA